MGAQIAMNFLLIQFFPQLGFFNHVSAPAILFKSFQITNHAAVGKIIPLLVETSHGKGISRRYDFFRNMILKIFYREFKRGAN